MPKRSSCSPSSSPVVAARQSKMNMSVSSSWLASDSAKSKLPSIKEIDIKCTKPSSTTAQKRPTYSGKLNHPKLEESVYNWPLASVVVPSISNMTAAVAFPPAPYSNIQLLNFNTPQLPPGYCMCCCVYPGGYYYGPAPIPQQLDPSVQSKLPPYNPTCDKPTEQVKLPSLREIFQTPSNVMAQPVMRPVPSSQATEGPSMIRHTINVKEDEKCKMADTSSATDSLRVEPLAVGVAQS